MNYYQRHLGDYAKDTGHLSLLEHGVYGVLLDWQYASEKALPSEKAATYRICRAMTKGEQCAVDRICGEFFTDGWNKRARQEIEFCKEVSKERQAAAVRKHHPDWSDEQVQDWCNTHANAPKKQSKSSATRARSNSQQPTANSIEGGAHAAGVQVGDGEILAWAAEWAGEPSSGTPKMVRAWVEQKLVQLNGRDRWPARWDRWLIACWRGEHRAFSEGMTVGNAKKSGGNVSASVTEISIQKKIAALSDEEDALAYEINALRQGNLEVPAGKLERLKSVREELKKLRG